MSTIVRAILMRELLDPECVEEALKVINMNYTKTGALITINQYLSINLTKKGAELKYTTAENWQNHDVNSFIEKLTITYTKLLEEKIERLKLEEARLQEKEALKEFAEEERKQKERELRKERMRLEAIKRREEAALRKQIEEKISALKQRAKKLGLTLSEEIKGKERRLVFVRR